MAAVYAIFFAEVAAYRIGTKKLAKLGVNYSMSIPYHLNDSDQ
jgi:zinc transporter 1/2/3